MRLISILMMTISLVACSSYKQEKKAVEQEAAQTNVKDAQSLGATIHDLINNSKTLSEEQKKELTEILSANKSKAEELAGESYQYRAVLIKELLSGKAKKSRVRILEKDIARVEKLRLMLESRGLNKR